MQHRIRAAGESRGFAVSRVITHWAEIAGPELAAMAQPVKISYPTSGIGATLTVLTIGPRAPFLEMRKEELRQRVNACYGYNAVTRIHITQTAPAGFAEPAAAYVPAPPVADGPAALQSRIVTREVRDGDLRAALEDLGRTILSRPKPQGRNA
jgi:hypothetical protein